MTVSIRNFLLISLLLTITLLTTLGILGKFYLDKLDIEAHMDTLLEQTARTFQALIDTQLDQFSAEQIQHKLDAIPTPHYSHHAYFCDNFTSIKANSRYQFQLWDSKGKLLLHSPKAPTESLATPENGLSNKMVNGVNWRVYTIHGAANNHTLIVGESAEHRQVLTEILNEDELIIVLLTYPLSGLLIWFIIGRGLRSLKQVANEVSHRAPSNLEPIGQQYPIPVEIKPIVDELNKLFLKLQQALEREQRFTGDAAHELRTPLAAIRTQAQVALKAVDHNDYQEILQNVIFGVDRATHIVQQLLTLSRLAPEALHLEEIHRVDLPKLVTEIVSQLAMSAIEKHIELSMEVEKPISTIEGNQTAISILVRNLVDNAIRYTPISGSIVIKIHEQADFVILAVIDTGPGIPPELRARVFERFYRILGSNSSGSGLGLAIVQKIATLHKAEVILSSLPDNTPGLVVTVKFPKSILNDSHDIS